MVKIYWFQLRIATSKNVSQQPDPKDSSTFKISGAKWGEQFIYDGLYDDFNMDEVDLSIEKYEVMFGAGNNDPENLFAQDGIDGLFGSKDASVAESVCQGGYAAKESSTGNGVQPACSNAASVDSVRSCKTEPNLCYGNPLSNISFSSRNGESTAGDYQDCGALSMLLMGEPPWCTPAHDSATPSGIRNDVVLRYKETACFPVKFRTQRHQSKQVKAFYENQLSIKGLLDAAATGVADVLDIFIRPSTVKSDDGQMMDMDSFCLLQMLLSILQFVAPIECQGCATAGRQDNNSR